MPGGKKGAGGGGGSDPELGIFAQESLIMNLTSGGITFSVGVPQDTLQSWIYTKPLDLDNADKVKFIERLIVHLTNRTNQTNMALEILGSDEENGPFDSLALIPLATNEPIIPNIDMYRFFIFQFIDFGVRERWRLHGFEVFGELGGDEF